MNYQCTSAFISAHAYEKYNVGDRIGPDEFKSLQLYEQKNFKELTGESFGEQVEDMIRREDHLENE